MSYRYTVFIKRATADKQQSFALQVDGYDLIQDIKAQIYKKINVPIHQQRLIFAGKQLDGKMTLTDYNITFEATIHLIEPIINASHKTTINDQNNKHLSVKQDLLNQFQTLNTIDFNVESNKIKVTTQKIKQSLLTLNTFKRDKLLNDNKDILINTLFDTLYCFKYNENNVNFKYIADILMLCFEYGLTDSFISIHNKFYKLFYEKGRMDLYFELISTINCDNPSIFKITMFDFKQNSGCSYKFTNDTFKEWEIDTNIIKNFIGCTGYQIIDCNDIELMIKYLTNDGIVVDKINCYLYIIHSLYLKLKNDYFNSLKQCIDSNEMIKIIVKYVMNTNINTKIVKYINNMNMESVQRGSYYLSDKLKDWKQKLFTNDDKIVINKWYIYIKTLTGKTLIFNDIDPTERIWEIKIRIENKEGIPPTSQRLIFAGLQLNDSRSLIDHKIRNGSTLHLVLRLKG